MATRRQARSGEPKKIAPGIYRDAYGFRVFQRVHAGKGGLHSHRFPKTATLTTMKAWQEDERAAHRKGPSRPAAAKGTLAADVARYLQLVATMPSYTDRERDLLAWVAKLGSHDRATLTTADYRLVLQQWRQTGKAGAKPLAASTVNHRRTALMHLYSVLDGKAAPNPLRDIEPFREPHPEPRDLGLDVVRAILGKVRSNKSGARLKALAWTGIRGSSEFSQMKPTHLDLDAGTCWVPTGKGGQARHLLLNANGIAAWREVIATKAWGTYSRSSLGKAFRLAIAKVNTERVLWLWVLTRAGFRCSVPLLVGVRPYDLRHTIATALRKAGADLADVQAFLGHRSQKMTQRYAPYHSEKLRKAVDGLER
jgi:integrase